MYGERKDRHQLIMMMNADELHEAHPWTAQLSFNQAQLKKEIDEKAIKKAASPSSCILGCAADGSPHSWVVGNEAGELLPKFLMAKLQVIESGKVYGRFCSITTNDEEKDRLFAMVREAQLRGIPPLAIKKERGKRPLNE